MRFNETYRVLQPMKYATAKKEEVLKAALESDNYCLQLKKDGSSYTWAKDLDGSVHLYGDKISKKTGEVIDKIDNVPHLRDYAAKHFPPGSQLLVEITFGDKSADVNTIMLALPAKAISRQEGNPVGAMVFDILFWAGEETYKKDFGDRWADVMCIFGTDLPEVPAWLSCAPTYYEDKAPLLARWLGRGEEGGVLKMLKSSGRTSAAHHVRELGATTARPMNTTFKVKQIDTLDVVITDVQMANKAYTGKDPENYPYRDENDNPVNRLWKLGMANGFVIGLYQNGELVRVGTVASGLDDAMRLDAAQNPDTFIGQVIEVDCMSKDNAACTLRHPRLMRMRPDKAAEDCLMSEVFRG
jgi:ATP-dependent DNA ligase